MSADEAGEDDGGDPLPRVPDATRVSDPRTSTPLTETFAPGTASDPPTGTGGRDDGCVGGSCDCGGADGTDNPGADAVDGDEIGRASCRERVSFTV
mgnify:CR=1 FL=1